MDGLRCCSAAAAAKLIAAANVKTSAAVTFMTDRGHGSRRRPASEPAYAKRMMQMTPAIRL